MVLVIIATLIVLEGDSGRWRWEVDVVVVEVVGAVTMTALHDLRNFVVFWNYYLHPKV